MRTALLYLLLLHAFTTALITLDGNLQEWTWQDRIDVLANQVVSNLQLFGRFEPETSTFNLALASSTATFVNGSKVWLNTDASFATSAPIWTGVSTPLVGGADLYVIINMGLTTCVSSLYNANTNVLLASQGAVCALGTGGSTLELQMALGTLSLSGQANAPGNHKLGLLLALSLATGGTQYLPAAFVASQSYWVSEAINNLNVLQRLGLLKPIGGHRVGIVYSTTSASRFYDMKSYSQLFQAAQHQVMMAGVPFDLLTMETDCVNLTTLALYDTLVLPQAAFVPTALVSNVSQTLIQAVYLLGLGLITSGDFLSGSETGAAFAAPYAIQQQLFGLTPLTSGAFGGPANVTVLTTAAGALHPVLGIAGFSSGEVIVNYANTYYAAYAPSPGIGVPPAACQSAVLASHATTNKPALYAIRMGLAHGGRGARMVHYGWFNLMGDRNTLWSAVRWGVFGDALDWTPALVSSAQGLVDNGQSTLATAALARTSTLPAVSLQLGRQDCVFAARCDADASQYDDEAPASEQAMTIVMTQLKAQYGFVSTDYLNVGTDPANQMDTDWTVMAPLWHNLMKMGHEIGTHSTTHPDYTDTLTPAGLVMEFGDSQINLTKALFGPGIPSTFPGVVGMAVPGNPETINTDACVARAGWFEYMSGTISIYGNGFLSAFGWLWPNSLADRAYAAPGGNVLAAIVSAPSAPAAATAAPTAASQLPSILQDVARSKRTLPGVITASPTATPVGAVSQIKGSTSHLGMIYLNMNLFPDFTMIEFYHWTASRGLATWLDQLDQVMKHASCPVAHWMYHDYSYSSSLYNVTMFTGLVASAASRNCEFVTGSDLANRMWALRGCTLQETIVSLSSSSAVLSVTLTPASLALRRVGESWGLGHLALAVTGPMRIRSITGWYAYSDTRVFLSDAAMPPLTIYMDATVGADPVMRITELGSRMSLMQVSGDGSSHLSFTVRGSGRVLLWSACPRTSMTGNATVANVTLTPQLTLNVWKVSIPEPWTTVATVSVACSSVNTMTPTMLPTTSMPTSGPTTLIPTMLPTTSTPTSGPTTLIPTAVPTSWAPTSGPTTLTPTAVPTSWAPTSGPTSLTPTAVPTSWAPTSSPTTASVTVAPTTSRPTSSPTTASVTAAPTTSRPTSSPTTAGVTAAPTTSRPTSSPTTAGVTVAPTTSRPTSSPTTASVTAAPTTSRPTSSPTAASVTAAPATSRPTSSPTAASVTAAPATSRPTAGSLQPTGPPTRGLGSAPPTTSPTTPPSPMAIIWSWRVGSGFSWWSPSPSPSPSPGSNQPSNPFGIRFLPFRLFQQRQFHLASHGDDTDAGTSHTPDSPEQQCDQADEPEAPSTL